MFEFLLSGLIGLPAIVGGVWILERSYARLECSRSAFELARTTLNQQSPRPSPGVRLENEGVRVTLRCGTLKETVYLPYLERRFP